MKIASILREKGEQVATTTPDAMMSTVSWELRSRSIGALVVSEDGVTMLGLISERDIVHGLAEHGARLLGMRAAQVMTKSPLTCSPEDTITHVMAQMTRHRVRQMPVVEGGQLRGIVSLGDMVKHRLDELELETSVLRQAYITR
jgi:CBS domain-containing protein